MALRLARLRITAEIQTLKFKPCSMTTQLAKIQAFLSSMKLQLDPKWLLVSYALLGGWLALVAKTSQPGAQVQSTGLGMQTVLVSNNMLFAETPQVTQTYAVSPEIIAVEIAAPDVELGQQIPYQPQPDDVVAGDPGYVQVTREGEPIGLLTAGSEKLLYTFDRVANSGLDTIADNPSSYLISSTTDPDYENAIAPTSIFRKSKPSAFANQANVGFTWPAAHTLFLTLSEPMESGKSYQLSFPGLGIANAELAYQPTQTRSEAVHVSQIGFRPDDPLKVGYLSTWMGNGGSVDYAEGLSFQLVNTQTNQPVYSGITNYTRGSSQAEDPKGRDYTLSEVHQLDFSSFSRPGDYRLCVEGVGCSFDFAIADTTWQNAFFTAARGFYHQRSGIAISEPYSSYERPRAFHPDDGVKIYQSNVKLMDVDMGLGDRDAFEALVATKTDQIVPNAWGGYFDAGDWDRRIQHLAVPRALFELHNLFPQHFDSVNLNIPESSNRLPDILDEALWSLDFFRRLQTPDGGIRGGVESAAHPNMGEASWQESLPIMAYAPDAWSSYLYAGVAARAAYTLQNYDAQLAATYRESALRAMDYAEREYARKGYASGPPHQVKDERNLAALELYRLTRESKWHDLFLATSVFHSKTAEVYIYGIQAQRDAAFLYARLNDGPVGSSQNRDRTRPLPTDPTVQANAKAAFLRYADGLVALTQSTAFGWSKEHPDAPLGWGNGLGAPKGTNLLQAHALTDDPKYLLAGLNSTQFSGGANPANMVFTTGLGTRSPQNPLIIDQRITGQAPPPGITLYGPADFTIYSEDWSLNQLASSAFPHPTEWPSAESYFDVYMHPISTEFTVDYMVSAAYTWGYLAAR